MMYYNGFNKLAEEAATRIVAFIKNLLPQNADMIRHIMHNVFSAYIIVL